MALGRYTEIARSANGDIIRAGEVHVYQAGTSTPAVLYTDDAGTVPAANPVVTDYTTGAWSVVAEGGLYDLAYPDGSVVHKVVIADGPGSDMQPADVQATAPLAWDTATTTISVTAGSDGDVLSTSGATVGWQPPAVGSVAGKTGNVALLKADVGLDQVDNTADADKPISTAVQAALDTKLTTPTLTTKVVLGTTLSTSTLGLVGYDQDALGDTLAMRQFGGQLTVAAPAADTDAATKAYADGAVAAKTQVAALTPIADPATATAQDVATAVNAIIAALQA